MKAKLVFLILLLSLPVLGKAPKRSDEHFQSHNDLKLTIEFALTFEEAKEIILRHYPDLKSDEEIRRLIADRDIQGHVVEGVEMHFAGFEHNLYTRYPELVKREPSWSATNTLLF